MSKLQLKVVGLLHRIFIQFELEHGATKHYSSEYNVLKFKVTHCFHSKCIEGDWLLWKTEGLDRTSVLYYRLKIYKICTYRNCILKIFGAQHSLFSC